MNDLTERVGTVLFNRGNFVPILPFEYGDSLSYLEEVGHLVAKVNEVVNAINNISVEILNEAKAYTDEENQKQIAIIDKAVSDVANLAADLNRQFDNFTRVVNDNLVIMTNRINGFSDDLTAGLNESHQFALTAIAQNNEYLMDELSKGLLNVKVVNYFTGELVTIQDMFDYMAQFHLGNAITADELRDAEITAIAFTNLHMTAADFVRNGKSIITP